jgi:hypothetical protein
MTGISIHEKSAVAEKTTRELLYSETASVLAEYAEGAYDPQHLLGAYYYGVAGTICTIVYYVQ